MSLLEELQQKPYKPGYKKPLLEEKSTSLLEQLKNKPLKSEYERGDSSNNILTTLFREPLEFGKEIAHAIDPSIHRRYIAAENSKTEMLNRVSEKYSRGEIDLDTFQRVVKILKPKTDWREILPETYQKTTKQIIGDVLGTALWITPVPEVAALKKMSTVARLARGAAIGGVAAGTYGMSKNASTEEIAREIGLGAAVGGPLELAAPAIFKGMGKVFKKTARAIKEKTKPLWEFLLPVDTRLRTLGPYGEELADRILTADRNALLKAGTRLERLESAGLQKLNDNEALVLKDALEGTLKREQLSQKVKKVFDVVDNLRKEIAQEAQAKGLKMRVLGRKGWDWKKINQMIDEGKLTKLEFKEDFLITKGKRKRLKAIPFQPRENYYPRFTYDINKLEKGKLREEMIEDAVRSGRISSREEAEMLLDSYIEFVDTNGRGGEYWVKYLVKTGQADSIPEARGMTLRYFRPSRNPRYGHLEVARELDFPFYDPDPRRVLPQYFIDATTRLEKVAEFGTNGKKISALLGKLQNELIKAKGYKEGRAAAENARILLDKAIEATRTSPTKQKISQLLRTIQTPKLAFAQLLNIGQSANTLLASDLPSLALGIKKAFTHEGVQRALKSGAIMESTIREMGRLVGSESKFANFFLKATGFSWTEKFNRIVASNTGMAYAERLMRKLSKNPTNKKILQQLAELGIDGAKALKRGLSEEDLLKAGQIMAEITQFRARPIDLPALASSPEGRVIFQFKNFVYNQTKFLKRQIVDNIQKGNYARAIRTIAILSILFPIQGEILSDIRSLITGSTRPTKFLDRYIENIANVGGMGIVADLFTSAKYDSLLDQIVGPTVSTLGRAIEMAIDIATTGKITDSQKRFIIQQTGIFRPIANYLIPPRSKGRQQIIELLKE